MPHNITLSTMKDRIRQIMEAKQMTQQAFASYLDLSAATLSSIFSGRTKPTLSTVEALKKKIPNINIEWLMFGSGNMFIDDNESIDSQEPAAHPTPKPHEPMLDFGFDDTPSSGMAVGFAAERHQEVNSVRNTPMETPKTEVRYIDKPQRHVIEIKVYYDDFTYESFYPSPKK